MFNYLAVDTVNVPNPDGLLDAIVILLVTAMVAIPSWLSLRNQKTLSGLEKQVANGHSRPLREDLDRVIESIGKLSDDVKILRNELISEEDRRRTHVGDVHDNVKDLREEMHRKFGELRADSAGTIDEMKIIHSKLSELENRFDG